MAAGAASHWTEILRPYHAPGENIRRPRWPSPRMLAPARGPSLHISRMPSPWIDPRRTTAMPIIVNLGRLQLFLLYAGPFFFHPRSRSDATHGGATHYYWLRHYKVGG